MPTRVRLWAFSFKAKCMAMIDGGTCSLLLFAFELTVSVVLETSARLGYLFVCFWPNMDGFTWENCPTKS